MLNERMVTFLNRLVTALYPLDAFFLGIVFAAQLGWADQLWIYVAIAAFTLLLVIVTVYAYFTARKIKRLTIMFKNPKHPEMVWTVVCVDTAMYDWAFDEYITKGNGVLV